VSEEGSSEIGAARGVDCRESCVQSARDVVVGVPVEASVRPIAGAWQAWRGAKDAEGRV
jgi:hypothetical protein